MDFTPGMRKLLGVWGAFNAAVRDRVTTADLYSRLRDAFDAEGAAFTGISGADVSRLRGVAVSQREAMRRFGALEAERGITAEHIGRDISSRSLDAQAAAPQWLVRFQANIVHEGKQMSSWVSSVFTGVLPRTKAALLDQLERDAQRVVEDRNTTTLPTGATFTGLGDVLILGV
jgi:hypothetical protein